MYKTPCSSLFFPHYCLPSGHWVISKVLAVLCSMFSVSVHLFSFNISILFIWPTFGIIQGPLYILTLITTTTTNYMPLPRFFVVLFIVKIKYYFSLTIVSVYLDLSTCLLFSLPTILSCISDFPLKKFSFFLRTLLF